MSFKEWVAEILTTIAFFGLMAFTYVLLVVSFPDPLLWSAS